ncbi:hypothetical protein NDU88_009042 [Pleurodeles waltl]|uniref:Uncharacterized protein n=1 Tax=Pleurodeles waltl TaxID=8319 RepID=A0AAV7PQY7_PLEWA|nr:hypothetical protein NDU88_009042 [Pleurodeles waltl]
MGNPCSEFLAEVELACLEEEQMEALEAPLDLEEMKSSIRELASAGFDAVLEDGKAQFAGFGARLSPSTGMPD